MTDPIMQEAEDQADEERHWENYKEPAFDLKKMKRYVKNDNLWHFLRNTEGMWAYELPLKKALEIYFNSEVIGNTEMERNYNDA